MKKAIIKLLRLISRYGWGFYLGGILAIVDVDVLNYKWWVIIVPTAFLVASSSRAYESDNV